jgi:hypothetical protein
VDESLSIRESEKSTNSIRSKGLDLNLLSDMMSWVVELNGYDARHAMLEDFDEESMMSSMMSLNIEHQGFSKIETPGDIM